MKWTTRDLQTALKFRDMGATDDEIATSMGRTRSSIRNKIGCKPAVRAHYHFARYDQEAAARIELQRALAQNA
jgi:predicted transcriptional regulator